VSAELGSGSGLEPEEPWEAEVEALLGRLPMVEPPEGFLVAALDHRPLRGGRTLVGMVALVVVAVAAVVGTDLIERTQIDLRLDPVVATLEVDADGGEGGPDPGHPSSPSSVDGDDKQMSLLDRLTAVADAVTRQLGFPDRAD
jgi:hypothetical protein